MQNSLRQSNNSLSPTLPVKDQYGRFDIGGPIGPGDIKNAMAADPQVQMGGNMLLDVTPVVESVRSVDRLPGQWQAYQEAENPIQQVLRAAEMALEGGALVADVIPHVKALGIGGAALIGLMARRTDEIEGIARLGLAKRQMGNVGTPKAQTILSRNGEAVRNYSGFELVEPGRTDLLGRGAIKLKNGDVVIDDSAIHAQQIQKLTDSGIPVSDIESGGFIRADGSYIEGSADTPGILAQEMAKAKVAERLATRNGEAVNQEIKNRLDFFTTPEGEGHRLPNLVTSGTIPKEYLPPQANQKMVTVYRGVRDDAQDAAINAGDWITLDPDYAAQHGTGPTGGSNVISMDVPADSIGWSGTDMNEYFYVPRNGESVLPTPEDYRGLHTAPVKMGKSSLDDATDIFPDDIYDPSVSWNYYGHGGPDVGIDKQSAAIISQFKGRPNKPVTIYRAVPYEKSASEQLYELEGQMNSFMRRGRIPKDAELPKNEWYDDAWDRRAALQEVVEKGEDAAEKLSINSGDWVTVNKNYAKQHGDAHLGGKYKIIQKKVTAKDLHTDGNSIHEWGYSPSDLD